LSAVREALAFRRAFPAFSLLAYIGFHLLPRGLKRWAMMRRAPLSGELRRLAPRPSPEAERIYFASRLQDALRAHIEVKIRELLRFEDKNSMAFSIETRLPFLDYRLVRFAHSLPEGFLLRNGSTKRVFRDAMRPSLDERIIGSGRKIGFETPEATWLAEPSLKDLVGKLLASESLRSRGLFDLPRLEAVWRRTGQGDEAAIRAVWRAVSVETWFRVFVDPSLDDGLRLPPTAQPGEAGR
jgi:asparagine synthase (glutamine-hydrolysing)